MSINQSRTLFEFVSPDGNNVLSTEGVKQSLLYIQRTPALSFEIQRGVQPIFNSKNPIPTTPMNPRQPIKSKATSGYEPTQIKFIKTQTPIFKLPQMLTPQTIVEGQNAVYSDGVPKINTAGQASVYENLTKEAYRKQIVDLRTQNKNREADELEQKYFPDQYQISVLQNQIAELQGLERNIGGLRVDADTHRRIAERQRADIQAELAALRAGGGGAPRVPAPPPVIAPRGGALSALAQSFLDDVKFADPEDVGKFIDAQIAKGISSNVIERDIGDALNSFYTARGGGADKDIAETFYKSSIIIALTDLNGGRIPNVRDVQDMYNEFVKSRRGRPITKYASVKNAVRKIVSKGAV